MIFWIVLLIVLLFGFTAFFGAPYVPSKTNDLKRAFTELYPLSDRDTLVDIGSGDGIVLRQARKYGAVSAVGYELNPLLAIISRLLARGDAHQRTILADFWRVQLPPETTVVYTFGDSRDIVKMAQKVQSEATRLKKPLYFISYGFAVPDLERVNEVGAHRLYRIAPLQSQKP